MKRSGFRNGLFAFLVIFLFVSMAGFASADVFINEFLANGIIEPDNEWVELFNNASSAVDLTGFNISETSSGNLTLSLTIPAKGFVILVENFTLFNSTFSNLNSTGLVVDYGEVVPSFQLSNTAGLIELYNASGDKIDSIEYAQASTQENVSIGRHPDGTKNIFNFSVQTPGAKNDNVAPVFNKWVIPSSNKTVVLSSLNITVNITDDASTVNASLVNFNGTNFSMTKSGDLWFFLWSISRAIDNVVHNVTVYFNDSNGFGSSNTIFNITAGHPPDFNKWIKPSANNSFISGLFNVTVNITDAVNKVNVSLINFNNSNFSMSNYNDLWYFVWNTSLNTDGAYNIKIFFNDSLGFSNTDTLSSITVDNTKPNISNPTTQANSRNFISPGFIFNATANAADTNLLNVTCALSGTTVGNFSRIGDVHTCNLTAPATEGDFVINITAIDKANNTNSTTINFTTKHSTSAAFTPKNITVSDLNQSEKAFEINVTLNNTGNNPIYDAGIILDSFSSTKFSAASGTVPIYQNCSPNINNTQSCTATFSIRIAGGTTGTHSIFWNRNWTDNNFTQIKFTQVAASTVTISSNPQMTTAANVSATIKHAQNSTLSLHINSTGNSDLDSVAVTFVPNTIQSSWLNATTINLGTISAATNTTLDVNVAVPKYTNPGNYTGTFSIAASSISTKTVLLIIEVPADNSWISFPNRTITHKRSDAAGIVGKFTINNTGNIGHNFTFPPAGNLFTFPLLWNDSNLQSIYVERGEAATISISHNRISGNAPETESSFNATFTITSKNTSQSNITFMSLVRDDNNPNLRILTPSNNSFIKGTIDFNVTSTDLNLSRLEYFINNSLVFNSTQINFTFKWNTDNGSYSDEIYKLKAIAFDSAGNVNQSEITVTVNNTDSAPILRASIPTINIVEDDNATLNLSLFFESIDGDTLKYNFTKPDNATVHVTNATQIANFTPAANFTGLNYIVFTAIDSSNQTASSNNVTINVTNVNDAPTTPLLTSPKNGSNVSSSTGKATLMWSASTDADNDAITYYVFVSNDSSNIMFNATTAATTLQLANLNNKNTYYWNVLASDSSLNSSNSTIFNFMAIRDNDPVINKWTWNNTINISSTNTSPIVAENRTLNFTINASDPENNPINFTWFVNSSEKSSAQNFSFNLINNFTAAGNYAIKLQVQDNNSNSVSQEWQVTVTNTNREPILDAISDKTIPEDSLLTFNITSFDPDNDSMTFASNITSILFTNAANNSLATVNWTPTNDNVGSNSVEFTVKDSSKNASQTITITVTNTNDAPTITDFFPFDNRTIAKNVGIQKFNVTFKDVDTGDDATAYWFRNTTLIASNSSNVTVTSLLEGIYNITAIVNDTSGVKARYEWKLNVTDAILGDGITSPVLSLNETQRQNATNVAVNESTFGGVDFGNNTLNFSGVVNLVDAFNISKGFVSVDTNTYAGLKNKSASIVMKGLNFTKAPLIYNASGFKSTAGGDVCPDDVCTNRTYDAANKILRFNVPHFSTYFTQTNTTNGAPVITSASVKTATENAKYTYNVKATDPDGDILTFSLITKPSGMSISSSTGVISWTPTTSQLGSSNVTVNVSDGSLTAEQSFNITVGKGPRLIISDLDVKVDTKTDKGMQNNTKISKEAAPGSKVEFKLEIENLFTNDEDLEIEDIDVEITIEDIDDGDDLDEDIDEFDLKAGKNEDVSIEFDIPLEVDEGIYDVIIAVEGEDENQTKHEILWNLELEVEKETHEIRILKADITPLTIACKRQVALNSEIINTGTEDEDEVTLEITSPGLGISSVTAGLELDEGTEDNRFTKKITESISKDILEGVYPVTFNAYYDSSLSETKTVDVTINECELTKAVKEKVKEKKPDVEVIRKVAVGKPEAKAAEPSFKQTGEYRTLLAIMVIVLIGTAVFVVGGAYMLLKK